jgi:hypothetical protein
MWFSKKAIVPSFMSMEAKQPPKAPAFLLKFINDRPGHYSQRKKWKRRFKNYLKNGRIMPSMIFLSIKYFSFKLLLQI